MASILSAAVSGLTAGADSTSAASSSSSSFYHYYVVDHFYEVQAPRARARARLRLQPQLHPVQPHLPPPTTSTTSSSSSDTSTTGSSSSTGSSISSSGLSSSTSAISTLSSTLTAPLTTSVQATVTSTGVNGAVITTVIETESVLSAGSVVTATSSASNNSVSSSSSHTGAIVGGVLGGVGGLIVILGILFFVLRRAQRKRELDEAFDGNFDPDRIVRAGGVGLGNSGGVRDSIADGSDTGGYAYAGGEKAKMKKQAKRASRGASMAFDKGTLPDIPVEGGHHLPEMQQLMPPRNNLLDEEGMDDDDGMGGRLNGTSIGGGIVTPYTLYNSNPSTVPSSPAASSSFHTPSHHSTFPLINTSSSDGHIGAGMTPARAAKEREAFGGRPPSMAMSSASMSGHGHPNPAYGPSPYAGYAPRPPSTTGSLLYGMGGSPPGTPPPQTPSFYPNPSGRSTSPGAPSAYASSTPVPPAQGRRYSSGPQAIGGGGLAVMNPDSTTPTIAPSMKSPQGHSTSVPREVLVHQDGGRVPVNLMDEDAGPEEIPPTYDSLKVAGRARPVEKA
ncbi:hypothetical protein BT96DRAFT_997944 [Gymnopus androsaceus JB14]|uniref:REJ domain-containing protein n=1 Tax=Gymnopus androsaceus JB14 TaxID=1447944 RepID=A0A6A4HBM1_9AGAR|nr:hypothetical protein BT96DRAFT_997944 [Gymnopus androsaceus JB14]